MDARSYGSNRSYGSYTWRFIHLAALLGGICLYAILPGITAWNHRTNNDFKHFYLGAQVLRQHGNPYDADLLLMGAREFGMGRINPYVYLCFTGQVMIPLALMSPQRASDTWFLLNHVFLFLGFGLLLASRKEPVGVREAALAVLLSALFFPWYRSLSAGQLNGALFLCAALTWWAWRRGWAPLAGATLAFAALFKLSPAIWVLYFLLKKEWKVVGWSVAFGVLFLGASLLHTPPSVQLDFVPLMKQMGYGRSTWENHDAEFYRDPYNQSANSLMHHLFTESHLTQPWVDLGPAAANGLTRIFALAATMTVLIVFWKSRRAAPDEQNATGDLEALRFSLFIFLSLLLPSLCWDHYLAQLFFPVLFIVFALERRRSWAGGVVFATGWYVAAIPIPFDLPRFQHGLGILVMSAKFWAEWALLGLVVVLILKRDRLRGLGI
ncbi:MAG: glycosyltransferase family 87 protein [bacterium]